jgi:Zn-dependent peptidase ImmA (M78 family)
LTESPEINLACRLAEKYRLKPPIDIDELAKRYARVVVTFLPVDLDVDGATFDLKLSGKRPTIVVNESRPRSRRRFTTAHELGHVLIPWHIGPILDELVLSDGRLGTPYWELESEANRFASEILMPTYWINEVVKTLEIPSASLEQIVAAADVSAFAAVIALNNNLPEGYVYARLNDEGRVASSGRSQRMSQNRALSSIGTQFIPSVTKNGIQSKRTAYTCGGISLVRPLFHGQ